MSDKFKYRSCIPEMMDATDVPGGLIHQCLHELDLLNRTLGGHTLTLSGIKKLVTDKTRTYHIVDLGCGSGDTLKRIAKWARTHHYKVRLTGIDINTDAINYLTHQCKDYPEIIGIVCDWQDYLEDDSTIDIVHCSLFCHHLPDNKLATLFELIHNRVKTGFVINDLRRNWLAYYCVYFITRLFRGSLLSKNDGPLSVLNGFKSSELRAIIEEAQIKQYVIRKKWAYRFLILGFTGNETFKT